MLYNSGRGFVSIILSPISILFCFQNFIISDWLCLFPPQNKTICIMFYVTGRVRGAAVEKRLKNYRSPRYGGKNKRKKISAGEKKTIKTRFPARNVTARFLPVMLRARYLFFSVAFSILSFRVIIIGLSVGFHGHAEIGVPPAASPLAVFFSSRLSAGRPPVFIGRAVAAAVASICVIRRRAV